jgi:hypothetical protein
MLKLALSFQQFLCKLHSKASQEKWKEQSGPLNLRSAIHCIWCPFTLIIHSLETIIIGSMSLNLKQMILQISPYLYDFRMKTIFGSFLHSWTHVLFTLFVFVCVYWCPTHIVLCVCSVFLRLGLPIVDFPFGIL